MKKTLILCSFAVAVLGACSQVPIDVNRGELIASQGVRDLFEQENLDAIEAGEQIRCERQRRVGTHMVQRVCMTVAEWDERKRKTNEEYVDNHAFAPCVNRGGSGRAAVNACGEGRGGR